MGETAAGGTLQDTCQGRYVGQGAGGGSDTWTLTVDSGLPESGCG